MMTSSAFKVLPLVAASAALLGSGGANALSIAIDDLSTGAGWDLIVNDQGVGDVNPLLGMVTFVASTAQWIANVTTGVSQPLLAPPQIDLSSVNVTSTSAGGHLILSVWDSYAAFPSVPGFIGNIGGTTTGTVAVDYTQYVSGGGAAAGGGGHVGPSYSGASDGLFGAGSFAGSVAFLNSAGSNPFDLAIDVEIVHTAAGSTSFNAEITPVPIPAAALLFGSALLGMVGVGRRKLAGN